MTEETFTRELERRAEHVHGAPLTIDDVRGRARSIRRRRQALLTGAAAAVIAAVIAVPMALGGSDSTRPDPAPSPTPTPSPAPTPTPAPTPVGPRTPGSSVLHDGVLTHPDGRTTPLDVDTTDLQQYGVLTDGRVVVPVPGIRLVRVYGPDGQLDAEYDVDLNVITMSADDTLVAWIDPDFRVVVLESGKAEPTTFEWGIPMPGESYGSIDAVHGSDCTNGGCTVLVGDFVTTTHVLSQVSEPAVELETGEPLRVAAVRADGKQWAVAFPPGATEQFGCSGVYDPVAGNVVAQNCDTTLWSYSPDGAHLTGARGDNAMWGSVEVLDQDLDVVLSYEPEDGQVIRNWGWADAEHLLVVVVGLDGESPDWSVLRVPIDGGEPEVVEGPLPGPNAESGPLFLVSD
ncbi:hypothetical protein [Nocardioides dilutus]